MSAAVAHGLRNPLASLRAAAQLAQRHPDTPAAREQLTAIISEVDRLDRRISHLLTFSRPAPFYPVAAGVASLVDSVLPAIAKPLRDRGVSIELDLAPDLPEVKVDPMKMEQVLLEILSNALDAMPTGGRITIKGRAVQAPNPESPPAVSIEISDTGRGIAAATMPSVFDPFFTTRPEGTGLGLSIAKRFIEQHQGRLELASRPGEGTTVTVWLPL
jgi:signal transduction histidine kinase